MTVHNALDDVWYNEIDPFAADWLEQLIQQGHIAPGVVDRRSIVDVKPSEIAGFKQCHFFAGVGVWSYALRLAGWSDDRPIWTGSCPCQPFSAAGKGGGFDDERHLWPYWHYLIEQCRPPEIAGEQVASKVGYAWLDLVQSDLEGMGYACGAIVSPSAGYGAPHERHRQFFGAKRGVEHATSDGRQQWRTEPGGRGIIGGCGPSVVADTVRHGTGPATGTSVSAQSPTICIDGDPQGSGAPFRVSGSLGVVGVAHDARLSQQQCERRIPCEAGGTFSGQTAERTGASISLVADTDRHGQRTSGRGDLYRKGEPGSLVEFGVKADDHGPTGPTNGFWSAADWLRCRDERWRPVEPGTFPLANGASARVGRLRGYGNAINAQQAKAFIEAFDSHSFGNATRG
jgi:DNA (cytosine-5)-methyltransferase 1